jgi:hypothetical protein
MVLRAVVVLELFLVGCVVRVL